MATSLGQPDEWFTARQLAERFRLRKDQLGLQRLGTRAASIARSLGLSPRKAPERQPHMIRAVDVNSFPLSVWLEAYGKTEPPAGRSAKPVTYKGIRFRSTLEGRTAVLLDGLGYEWEYEPEKLALPSGRYWPDFRVIFGEEWIWWEVKHPRALAEGRDPRWSELVLRSGYGMVVSYGLWRPDPFEDSGQARMFQGRVARPHQVAWNETWAVIPDRADGLWKQKLLKAYGAARDERFDDGDPFSVAA